MKNFGSWLQQKMQRINAWMTRFMDGRYGMDKLSSALLWISIALVLIALFLPTIPKLIATVTAYVLMGLAIFRALSRNTYKRYKENRRFLMMLEQIKDRDHKYFSCPKCHQPVRVPRKKGKIAITCPKCKEKFIKKT